MAELPTGMVTFLFSDIDGSTRLFRQLGSKYHELLEQHNGFEAAWQGGYELLVADAAREGIRALELAAGG